MTCCCGVVVASAGNSTAAGNRPGIDANTITDLVHNAGGNIDALFRASLSWDSWSDIDFHINEPDGTHIFFSQKKSKNSGGTLDVDMNVGSVQHSQNTRNHSKPAVENIVYTDLDKMADGVYKINFVQYGVYSGRAIGGDAPYLLLENRTQNEPRMSHYVLLKWNGENQSKDVNNQIHIASVRKSGTGFALESLGPGVTIVHNHNFNLGPFGQ